MQLQPLIFQTQVIKAIRLFFEERGFHEIMIPVLQTALPLEPNIFAFSTQWQTSPDNQALYLSTSPESALKKVMAAGLGNCYAIGHASRNLEGVGSRHRPDFLMLEWYRPGANYRDIMAETQELVKFVHKTVNKLAKPQLKLNTDWPVLSLETLFKMHANLEMEHILDDGPMIKAAQTKGYATENATWSQLFDQIFLNEIEPHLTEEPCFIIDFPARLSPLCQVRSDKPYLAERFEVFIKGMEIGNGNTENLDSALVAKHFQQEADYRQARGLPTHPIDTEFITALKQLQRQQTSLAGIGLGISRLAMVLGNLPDITVFDISL
jgi:lysyl-tRNA synthetase class 2